MDTRHNRKVEKAQLYIFNDGKIVRFIQSVWSLVPLQHHQFLDVPLDLCRCGRDVPSVDGWVTAEVRSPGPSVACILRVWSLDCIRNIIMSTPGNRHRLPHLQFIFIYCLGIKWILCTRTGPKMYKRTWYNWHGQKVWIRWNRFFKTLQIGRKNINEHQLKFLGWSHFPCADVG